MKRTLALMAGSLLLQMTSPVTAQSGSPPYRGLQEILHALIMRSNLNRSQKDSIDSLKTEDNDSLKIVKNDSLRTSKSDSLKRNKIDSLKTIKNDSLKMPKSDSLKKKYNDPSASVPSLQARNKLSPADEKAIKDVCGKLVTEKRKIYYLSDRVFKMNLQLRGIYTKEEMLFFQIALSNHSHLDYDVDSVRFYVTDKQPARNGHPHTNALCPLYVYGNIRVIRGKSREICVIVLPKFTVPVNKRFVMLVLEKNGGRHLQLQADNFTLVRARLISS